MDAKIFYGANFRAYNINDSYVKVEKQYTINSYFLESRISIPNENLCMYYVD